jgi:Mn2+/Fe2+ NRAMP family transporter
VVPTFSADVAFWTTVVAIFGTTISPYLFFWQASQRGGRNPGRAGTQASGQSAQARA